MERPSTAGRRIVVRFLSGAVVDSFGAGIASAAALLYFVTIRGLSAESVALAMSIGAVLAIAAPMPFGRLADGYGISEVYLLLLVARGLLYLGYPLAGSFWAYLLLTVPILALDTTTPPMQQALVGRLFDEHARVRLMAAIAAARNAAMASGTLVAGLALATRSALLVGGLLALNGISFFVLAAVVFSLRRELRGDDRSPGSDRTAEPAPEATPALRNPAFLGLSAANGVLMLHDSVLFILLPLWTVTRLGRSPLLASAMIAVNMVLTVVMQMALARVHRLAARPNLALLLAVAALIAACLLGVVVEHSGNRTATVVGGCLALVILLTVGENLHTLAGWQVSFAVAPPARSSEYISVFSTGYAVQRVVGPVLMTVVVLGWGTGGWLVLGAIFVASALIFRVLTGTLLARLREPVAGSAGA